MPPLQTAYSIQAKGQILWPPLSFAMIFPGEQLSLLPFSRSLSQRLTRRGIAGVYRCGHPNTKNFPFMDTLGLKSIMYACNVLLSLLDCSQADPFLRSSAAS